VLTWALLSVDQPPIQHLNGERASGKGLGKGFLLCIASSAAGGSGSGRSVGLVRRAICV